MSITDFIDNISEQIGKPEDTRRCIFCSTENIDLIRNDIDIDRPRMIIVSAEQHEAKIITWLLNEHDYLPYARYGRDVIYVDKAYQEKLLDLLGV